MVYGTRRDFFAQKITYFYWKLQRYWRIILLICVVTGVLSKPLGMLNSLVIEGMWELIAPVLRLGL